MPSAILLIAHGSRRTIANADLARLADVVRLRRPGEIVEFAYLELAEPSIPAVAARCVERGAEVVLMSPFFLSAGNHVAEDLTSYQREFNARWPRVTFRLCPPLGVHPLLVEALLDRLGEDWNTTSPYVGHNDRSDKVP